MAQAAQASTTSRRNFLAGASALPISAVPLAAQASTPIDPLWLEVGERLRVASDAHWEATIAHTRAQQAMSTWTATNPYPKASIWPAGDKEAEKAAIDAYCRALPLYAAKRTEAMTDILKAELTVEIAEDIHAQMAWIASDFEAATAAELVFKAGLVEHDHSSNLIAQSIADDLLRIELASKGA